MTAATADALARLPLRLNGGSMSIKLQLPKLADLKPRLTVIGVGGAGCNAINNMIEAGLTGVEFVVANTDAQALAASHADQRIQLGATLTEGLGAGSKPEIGQAAAEEAIEDLRQRVAGSHMVFIAAGMGGGTGTGAAAVIARVAKELGILTVGVVTKPFQFEGARRSRIADVGINELRKYVDTLIVIPNQNLFRIASDKTTFAEAFILADQVLYSGVACIVDLIVKEGLINLDFADVRTVMTGMGTAMMGTGEASGERRAIIAAEEAIANPLLDDVTLKGAKGLLLSITGGSNLTLYEVDEAASRVRQEIDPEANIIVGATFDESLGDRVRVSIVASGMTRTGERAQTMASSEAPFMSPPPLPVPPMGYDPRRAPDPLPMAPAYAPRTAENFQQRLSTAMQYGDPASAPHPAYVGPAHYEPTPMPPQASWHSPDGVEIEDGLPPAYSQAPPSVYGHASHDVTYDGFAPAPPAEVRRAPRRMPEVEDFPAVGQRDYYAKTAGQAPADPLGYTLDGPGQPASPPRKRGLFARLTGRGRDESDSRGDRTQNTPEFGSKASPAATGDDRGRSHSDSKSRHSPDPAHRSEKPELPVFFSKPRR